MPIKSHIHNESVFVVSGGAKGITAKCTIKLAQKYPCKFILLGRSELIASEPEFAKNCFDEATLKKRIMEYLLATGTKPTPMSVQKMYNQIASNREIQQTLAAIKQAGGYAEYLSVDVTNIEVLKAQLHQATSKLGKVTGIIHGAGNLADKLIEKKTADDFEKVYTAKVQGLENLLNCVPASQLEHLVLFSSVTGFYGNIGQSDYAIANEILNKSAHLLKQQHPECHVVAINWGGWDSGMVTPELKKEFARRGIDIIPVDAGTQMLVNELNPAHQDTTQVVIGSPMILPPAPLGNELRTYRVRRRLQAEANPFLADHTIAGNLVLPATCAVSWIADTCEHLYPGYRFFCASNFRVLKGITFNENLASEHIVELQEISKIDGQEVELQAKIFSYNAAGKPVFHFSANPKLVREIPAAPIYENLNLEADHIISLRGKEFYQQEPSSLFHGASFQEMKRIVNISPEKITAECFWKPISFKQQGQFPVDWMNPYATDLSTHPLWIWLYHFHQQICLPGQMERYEQFARTPVNQLYYVSCEIQQKTTTGISANFIVHDQEGNIFSRLLGTKGIILPKLLG
ncbi:SDR family NAD(P)-dependent oxidoreductase [Calothrix sp. UHCC 0171]|uniref:SDR family NAD(P)-dependent oxidoreductase n=1 Tax=Calothrix sp. UHCC 0171 TaxID=3110245 RepID=UPI002B1F7E03|nr:SDR family NAD(P)-dependent oxidoreductase [Calothrix sp. UHCC 0171]MEA5572934.1 SDR family NAD(P)-dependent oxidoreductase [Calothrix sp. UHCC 0171]